MAGLINSDLAFWGKMAVRGTYEGFRLIDVRLASRPKEIINYEDCAPDSTAGNQGDVIIYENIVVRSWNSPAPSGTPVRCDGQLVPGAFEGLHVFDISNKLDPQLVGSVDRPAAPTRPRPFRISRTTGSHLQQLVERHGSVPRHRDRRGAAGQPGQSGVPALRVLG